MLHAFELLEQLKWYYVRVFFPQLEQDENQARAHDQKDAHGDYPHKDAPTVLFRRPDDRDRSYHRYLQYTLQIFSGPEGRI